MATALGIFGDTGGDIASFDAALQLLAGRGARRFLFAGGRYEDLDEWLRLKREEARAQADYSNGDFLEDVSRYLLGLDQLERPAAFGSAWELARAIEDVMLMKDKVVRTPERGSLQYQDSSVPRKAMDIVGDVLCCVVHDKNDLDKDDMVNAAVLVHGKEGAPKVVQIGPRYFVTPGRVKGGSKSSVGLLEVVDRQLVFSAFSLDGATLIDRQPLPIGGTKTKLSVK
ncbi:MAG: hypothetical protein INH41_09700 [Myxococcaceae bacterium]|jgi:hypothetical protein|nr:hypothetical protein [Myxococcaceae bacterium]MCA3012658.1 hypothetical protein [Myxococcaceae bacterium]